MEPNLRVQIVVLPHGRPFELPKYETQGAAGMDLIAALETPVTLEPGGRSLVPTGIAIAVPRGFEAQVRPRSGLAIGHGITCLNSPGTIDSDYRGEIKIILINHSRQDFCVEPGMRIAQILFAPVSRVDWEPVEDLESTTRGEGGFGHTGT